MLVDLLPVNAFVALARIEPTEAFKKVERQVSISALVTAHAFFELVIKDLLRVTILCNRQKWIEAVQERSIAIGVHSRRDCNNAPKTCLRRD